MLGSRSGARSRPRRRMPSGGFTLVELLVVIAIIGILVALLLPAIQAAREAARRSQCNSKVKQMALALHSYHDVNGRFPPGYGIQWHAFGARWAQPQEPEWSWVARVLPYMEQVSLGEEVKWDWNPGLANTGYPPGQQEILEAKLTMLWCPSDPSVELSYAPISACGPGALPNGHTRTSYAGNFGRGALEATDGTRVPGVFRMNFGARIGDILDGTSTTLLTAEIIPGDQCQPRGHAWYDEGPVFMQDYGPNDPTPDCILGCGDGPGAKDHLPGSRSPCVDGYTNPPAMGAANHCLYGSRSYHPGGVIVSFCDGSVDFVSDSIDLGTWQALGTRAGGEATSGL